MGAYFRGLPAARSNITLHEIEGASHCLHDDSPDEVHAKLLPWLASLELPLQQGR